MNLFVFCIKFAKGDSANFEGGIIMTGQSGHYLISDYMVIPPPLVSMTCVNRNSNQTGKLCGPVIKPR